MYQIIKLTEKNCRDCYKCIRNCNTKAIRYADGHAEILPEECIDCGECVVACPRHGNFVENDLEQVQRQMRSGRQIVASIDPSFIAEFDVSCLEDLNGALAQLGFAAAEEMAIGAEIVSREYERIMLDGEKDVLISSVCPSINLLIRKFYPDMLKYLAPVASPMQVHCRRLRRQYPGAYIVYIGPCYARKREAHDTGCCDAVLMFSDLKQWLHEQGIHCVNSHTHTFQGIRARRYPRQDGIVKSMTRVAGWNRVSIDGVSDCIAALEEMRQRGADRVFLEMTACEGSCVNGPAIRSNRYENRIHGTVAVNSYAGEFDFGVEEPESIRVTFEPDPIDRVPPDEDDVEQTLELLNKAHPHTALNCGCCGYPTCREMAQALCEGKSELDMCLPYLHEKAERHSREVVSSTLEAADRVIDKQMRVVQDIASILGETTAETKVMLVKLKEAIQ